ncbi:hypothetical protein B0T26DRAFT_753402 [Lasiosphaeria miniovina]|uniref:Uncharacterized protein n=1 Tax=Lasiosphaeria miniovina TaxID=1954250 RepID=A0AA40ACD7_9PEZI|nr:uncharacterized protein B0T26DRAFT_753402 [Lasiosphaeria miniovina]KAK0713276.1 hypothetical protein B0T26DRAFT_753402 [Lasiosphaeria miniovina]
MDQQLTPQDLFNICDNQWRKAFVEGPHTSFKMVEAMRDVMGLTYQDILTHPERLAAFQEDSVQEEDIYPGGRYYDTWGSLTGRCTSFAIKVVSNLEDQYPGYFHFGYFNIGPHRLGRCDKTQILIDSTSNNGVKRQPARMEVMHFDAYGNPGLLSYEGLIRWRLSHHRIELSRDMDNGQNMSYITFDGSRGSAESNNECLDELYYFIEECGGEEQWKADEINVVNRDLWKAAVREWGWPVWTEDAAPPPNSTN